MASLPPLPKAVIEITYMSPSDWGRPLTGYGTGAPELDLPICCLLTTGYGPQEAFRHVRYLCCGATIMQLSEG